MKRGCATDNIDDHEGERPQSAELPTLDGFRECTCFNLRKGMRVVTQLFDNAMRSINIRGTQYTLFVLVLALGPISVSKLAEEMVTDRTTLSRNLEPMRRNGLIKIGRGEDRRTRIVKITDSGRKKLEEAYPIWRKTQEDLKTKIGLGSWASMMTNLSELVNRIRL